MQSRLQQVVTVHTKRPLHFKRKASSSFTPGHVVLCCDMQWTRHDIYPADSELPHSQPNFSSKQDQGPGWLAILIVRFLSRSTCLYIYVDLPAASFLQSYTAYMSVDKEIDHGSVNLPSKPLTKQDRDILLLHDEMKIKDKLGYDWNTGQLTGFTLMEDVSK